MSQPQHHEDITWTNTAHTHHHDHITTSTARAHHEHSTLTECKHHEHSTHTTQVWSESICCKWMVPLVGESWVRPRTIPPIWVHQITYVCHSIVVVYTCRQWFLKRSTFVNPASRSFFMPKFPNGLLICIYKYFKCTVLKCAWVMWNFKIRWLYSGVSVYDNVHNCLP